MELYETSINFITLLLGNGFHSSIYDTTEACKIGSKSQNEHHSLEKNTGYTDIYLSDTWHSSLGSIQHCK